MNYSTPRACDLYNLDLAAKTFSVKLEPEPNEISVDKDHCRVCDYIAMVWEEHSNNNEGQEKPRQGL